jgi:hypothetical protein
MLYPWVVCSEGRALVVRLTSVSAVAVLACLDRGGVVGQVLPLIPEVDELTHRVAVLRPVMRHLRMTEAVVRALAQPPLLTSPPRVALPPAALSAPKDVRAQQEREKEDRVRADSQENVEMRPCWQRFKS